MPFTNIQLIEDLGVQARVLAPPDRPEEPAKPSAR
jgi:hypothetical protein